MNCAICLAPLLPGETPESYLVPGTLEAQYPVHRGCRDLALRSRPITTGKDNAVHPSHREVVLTREQARSLADLLKKRGIDWIPSETNDKLVTALSRALLLTEQGGCEGAAVTIWVGEKR